VRKQKLGTRNKNCAGGQRSASKIRFFAKQQNVICLTLKDDIVENERTENERKMLTLQQNQKSCIPTLKADPMQHICFCPNA
jgi:hypothetical protein